MNAFELLGRSLAVLTLAFAGLLALILVSFLVLFLFRLPGRHPSMGPGYCAVRTLCWMFTKVF